MLVCYRVLWINKYFPDLKVVGWMDGEGYSCHLADNLTATKTFKEFYDEVHSHLPTYLPTYLPTHLPTYPPTYLPTYLKSSITCWHLHVKRSKIWTRPAGLSISTAVFALSGKASQRRWTIRRLRTTRLLTSGKSSSFPFKMVGSKFH